MSHYSKSKELRVAKLPLALEAYLAVVQVEDRQSVEDLWQAALAEARSVEFMDLWERRV